ncbi:MAG: hypothetical protein QXG05_07980 [Nitrososphaerota archaeon]
MDEEEIKIRFLAFDRYMGNFCSDTFILSDVSPDSFRFEHIHYYSEKWYDNIYTSFNVQLKDDDAVVKWYMYLHYAYVTEKFHSKGKKIIKDGKSLMSKALKVIDLVDKDARYDLIRDIGKDLRVKRRVIELGREIKNDI